MHNFVTSVFTVQWVFKYQASQIYSKSNTGSLNPLCPLGMELELQR